ncbi:MAG TPA: dihydrofolate reductase family protein [Longimicrobiaceae bacterium]
MKTQYYTASSLDGFIADADNSLEWLLQFGDPPEGGYEEFIREVGAVAMGSTTYQWLLDNYIHLDQPDQKPWPYDQSAWVFTTGSLSAVPGADIRFVRGDVRPVHQAMAEAANGKNIWLIGGGELVGQFHDHGLLDELIVTIASVTLGGGAPLLPRAIVSPPLKLISARAQGEGFVELRYEVQKER